MRRTPVHRPDPGVFLPGVKRENAPSKMVVARHQHACVFMRQCGLDVARPRLAQDV